MADKEARDPFAEMSSTQIEVYARTLLAENRRLKGALAISPPPAARAGAPRINREALVKACHEGMLHYVMEGPAGMARRIEAAISLDSAPEAPPPGQSAEHHWVGGNDITWCTKCGVEYDHRKTLRPTVECTPSPAGQQGEAMLEEAAWTDEMVKAYDTIPREHLRLPLTVFRHGWKAALRASAQPTPPLVPSKFLGIHDATPPAEVTEHASVNKVAWLEMLLAEAVDFVALGSAQIEGAGNISRSSWLELAKSATKHVRREASHG